MVKLMLRMAMFPVVWRSDNAKVFVSEVVSEMNKMLEIGHVAGSTYHPQSQGYGQTFAQGYQSLGARFG